MIVKKQNKTVDRVKVDLKYRGKYQDNRESQILYRKKPKARRFKTVLTNMDYQTH